MLRWKHARFTLELRFAVAFMKFLQFVRLCKQLGIGI